jgi:hypothetical protein
MDKVNILSNLKENFYIQAYNWFLNSAQFALIFNNYTSLYTQYIHIVLHTNKYIGVAN